MLSKRNTVTGVGVHTVVLTDVDRALAKIATSIQLKSSNNNPFSSENHFES